MQCGPLAGRQEPEASINHKPEHIMKLSIDQKSLSPFVEQIIITAELETETFKVSWLRKKGCFVNLVSSGPLLALPGVEAEIRESITEVESVLKTLEAKR